MLFALAVLVIGGTVLFTGPVQAVVENFYRLENGTATDSSLCPNTTYTFLCEISGDELRLTSFDSSGLPVNGFIVAPENANAGTALSHTEFNFTAFNSVNGLIAATAVMDSSMNLASVELECRDADDMNFTSLSTVVNRDPLDALDPDCLHVTCVVYGFNVTFIRVTWQAIACAQSYVLDISDVDSITTSETSHQASYSVLRRNISGSLLVVGGSVLPFFEQCSVLFNETTTIPPPATTIPPPEDTCPAVPENVPGFEAIPVYEGSCCDKTKTGYNISVNNLPAGATAYYETSDGSDEGRNIIDDSTTIFSDSPVTVTILCEDGTVYYFQELPVPSVSGDGVCCIWLFIAVALILIVLGFVSGNSTVIVAKCYFGRGKVSSQGESHDNVDLATDGSEMKMRGSDM